MYLLPLHYLQHFKHYITSWLHSWKSQKQNKDKRYKTNNPAFTWNAILSAHRNTELIYSLGCTGCWLTYFMLL